MKISIYAISTNANFLAPPQRRPGQSEREKPQQRTPQHEQDEVFEIHPPLIALHGDFEELHRRPHHALDLLFCQ